MRICPQPSGTHEPHMCAPNGMPMLSSDLRQWSQLAPSNHFLAEVNASASSDVCATVGLQ